MKKKCQMLKGSTSFAENGSPKTDCRCLINRALEIKKRRKKRTNRTKHYISKPFTLNKLHVRAVHMVLHCAWDRFYRKKQQRQQQQQQLQQQQRARARHTGTTPETCVSLNQLFIFADRDNQMHYIKIVLHSNRFPCSLQRPHNNIRPCFCCCNRK